MSKEENVKLLNDLKVSVIAILEAIKDLEVKFKTTIMPEGTFLGVEFKDDEEL